MVVEPFYARGDRTMQANGDDLATVATSGCPYPGCAYTGRHVGRHACRAHEDAWLLGMFYQEAGDGSSWAYVRPRVDEPAQEEPETPEIEPESDSLAENSRVSAVAEALGCTPTQASAVVAALGDGETPETGSESRSPGEIVEVADGHALVGADGRMYGRGDTALDDGGKPYSGESGARWVLDKRGVPGA